MKKLIFIPFIFAFGIIFNSCNVGDTGNSTTFPLTPAVIDFDRSMGGIVMATGYGVVAAPSLNTSNPGDCIFVHEFTVDYDNQPSPDYYTATNILKNDVNQSYLEESSSIYLSDYTLPISAADGVQSVFFNGKFFTLVNCKDKSPSFRLIYNKEEPEIDWIKNFYLVARPSSPNTVDLTSVYAFDMYDFIYTQGRDTIITVIGHPKDTKYKYIKANLNYFTKMSDNDNTEPEFKNVSEPGKPFDIIIFFNNLQ